MIDIEIEDEAWVGVLPDVVGLTKRAAAIALTESHPLQISAERSLLPSREKVSAPGSGLWPARGQAQPTDEGARGDHRVARPVAPSSDPLRGPPSPARGEGNLGANITILLTDDDTVADLNTRFLGKSTPTNVLSFPAAANPENHLGDIALAFGVCAREAHEQGKPLADHLAHLVIHGVLHLLGYDHQDEAEAERMESIERDLLAGLDIPDPYAIDRGGHVHHQ